MGVDVDGEVVDDLHLHDVLQPRARIQLDVVSLELQVVLDHGGSERLTVVERHVWAQVELPDGGFDRFP